MFLRDELVQRRNKADGATLPSSFLFLGRDERVTVTVGYNRTRLRLDFVLFPAITLYLVSPHTLYVKHRHLLEISNIFFFGFFLHVGIVATYNIHVIVRLMQRSTPIWSAESAFAVENPL